MNYRILSQISYKTALPSYWEVIGYELIAEHEVTNISQGSGTIKEKCFTMLKTWLETDSNSCYCQLFAALETYKYCDLLRKVKKIIIP